MSTRFIKLDSAQRINFNTTTAASFTLKGTNMVVQGRYDLKSIIIPITFYNVSASNNAIYFNDTTGNHRAVIPEGFYTAATYITAIGAAMTSAGSGSTYTAFRDTVSLCLKVVSSNNAFCFTFGSNTLNSAAIMMGYAQADTLAAYLLTASNIVNISQTRSFNISINNYSNINGLNGNGYTFVIPVTGTTPSLMSYEPTQWFNQSFVVDSPTQTLDIAVYDDNHVLLNCFSDFYMILENVSQ